MFAFASPSTKTERGSGKLLLESDRGRLGMALWLSSGHWWLRSWNHPLRSLRSRRDYRLQSMPLHQCPEREGESLRNNACPQLEPSQHDGGPTLSLWVGRGRSQVRERVEFRLPHILGFLPIWWRVRCACSLIWASTCRVLRRRCWELFMPSKWNQVN